VVTRDHRLNLFPRQIFHNLVDNIGGALPGIGHMNGANDESRGEQKGPDGKD
jgi:hypothetical protein